MLRLLGGEEDWRARECTEEGATTGVSSRNLDSPGPFLLRVSMLMGNLTFGGFGHRCDPLETVSVATSYF